MNLDRPITTLKGVGEQVAAKLERLGIRTVLDLLYHYPRRYDDFSKITTIRAMRPGLVTLRGQIQRVGSRRAKSRYLNITEAIISDRTGTVKAVWFNQPYLKNQLPIGTDVLVSGKLEFRNNDLAIQAPAIEPADEATKNTARIVPVYPETEGLSSRQMRTWILPLLPQIAQIEETLPPEVVAAAKLMPITEALTEIHFPSTEAKLKSARHRIAFEELFFPILTALAIKHEIKTESAPVINFSQSAAKKFIASLAFDFTDAQRRAAWEIMQDMWRDVPMNRLLEGDVGSGKTVVATLAAYMAIQNDFQVALMVPTEVLARQHATKITPMLAALGYETELIVGSQKAAAKRSAVTRTKEGSAHLIIGTHALLGEQVAFQNLGLVIIDEQHRFGVGQRAKLKEKAGKLPHLLTMTATPIPRSLALTVYGDLDISVIDALPPGRSPIATQVVKTNQMDDVYEVIENEIKAGRQAFVICPLINESDNTGAKSVIAEAKRLAEGPFQQRRIGQLHGKMSAEDKQTVMQQMAEGSLDILVATTVIEVGIDIPNATVMLIEGAASFGLATLHQIRGRVGRGAHKSFCYLVADQTAAGGWERLKAMEKTSDGFRLAQIDLELRGPGQIYGLRQHGDLDLEMADIGDTRFVAAVRTVATTFASDPANLLKYDYVRDRVSRLKAVTSLD